jgi:hypothetical protein
MEVPSNMAAGRNADVTAAPLQPGLATAHRLAPADVRKKKNKPRGLTALAPPLRS